MVNVLGFNLTKFQNFSFNTDVSKIIELRSSDTWSNYSTTFEGQHKTHLGLFSQYYTVVLVETKKQIRIEPSLKMEPISEVYFFTKIWSYVAQNTKKLQNLSPVR